MDGRGSLLGRHPDDRPGSARVVLEGAETAAAQADVLRTLVMMRQALEAVPTLLARRCVISVDDPCVSLQTLAAGRRGCLQKRIFPTADAAGRPAAAGSKERKERLWDPRSAQG